MIHRCDNRVAVVTGASRGIGQAIATRLAAEGAKVVLLGRDSATRNTELAGTLEETVALIERVGGQSLVIRADITDPGFDKSTIADRSLEVFGSAPDILVHSAAAPREFGDGRALVPFADTSREFFFRAVEVNVWAAWDLAKAFIPGMRRQGAGWILLISSIQAAPRPTPVGAAARNALGGACVYGGTKAFLDRITTGAALELYDDNIAVNNLSPTGPVKTPLSATVTPHLDPARWEPMETMVEAALALCTGDPKVLTSRIAYSLPLLAELGQAVHTLDAAGRFGGWQPDGQDREALRTGYLDGH